MENRKNDNKVESPTQVLEDLQVYFASIYKEYNTTIHHMRDDFESSYTHKKDVYEAVTNELGELWRLESRNQGRYEEALKLQEKITELQSEIHTLHGEAGYQKKRTLPSREEWGKRCANLEELKKRWDNQKDHYSKEQIPKEDYVDNMRTVFHLRMMVIRSGYIDIDLKDLNREFRNLQKKKVDLKLQQRVIEIKSEIKEPERLIDAYTEAKQRQPQRTPSQLLRRVDSFERKFNTNITKLEQSILEVKDELNKTEKEEILSTRELQPLKKELESVSNTVAQRRQKFEGILVEERRLHAQLKAKAVDISVGNSSGEGTSGTTQSRNTKDISSLNTKSESNNIKNKEKIVVEQDKILVDERIEEKKEVPIQAADVIDGGSKSNERIQIPRVSPSKPKKDTDAITIESGTEQELTEELLTENPNQNKGLSFFQRMKQLKKPHNIIGLARFLLHLWPLATWPLCTLWVAMILPGPYFLLYGMATAGLIYGAINLSFYLPKIVTYIMQRRQTKQQQKEQLQKDRSLQKEKSERTKEQTLTQNHQKEYAQKKRDIVAQQQSNTATQEKDVTKRSMLQGLKKHLPLLAVMVLGSAVIGGLGVFLMPAILGTSLMPLIVGGTFTLGTLALVGTSASIATQLIDKYALEKAQMHFKEKDQQLLQTVKTHDREAANRDLELGKEKKQELTIGDSRDKHLVDLSMTKETTVVNKVNPSKEERVQPIQDRQSLQEIKGSNELGVVSPKMSNISPKELVQTNQQTVEAMVHSEPSYLKRLYEKNNGNHFKTIKAGAEKKAKSRTGNRTEPGIEITR